LVSTSPQFQIEPGKKWIKSDGMGGFIKNLNNQWQEYGGNKTVLEKISYDTVNEEVILKKN
jgi:hypothetical protein